HRHQDQARGREAGDDAPAPPQHREEFAQLGVRRAWRPRKSARLQVRRMLAWEHGGGDLERAHDQNAVNDRPAPTRTTLVRNQYPEYGTILIVEAGTETTSPPWSVRSFASPSWTALTSTSMRCFVPPGTVRQTTTPCRSAGNS